MDKSKQLKIAITHDYLYEYGGAEMVLWELARTYPDADIYTPIYRPTSKPRAFWFELNKHSIKTSLLGKLPLPKILFKLTIPLQIRFFRKLKLDDYDLVISSSAAFAKWIDTESTHIAYIHTPPRFLWGYDTSTFHRIPRIIRLLATPILARWRKLDLKYTKEIKHIITNSENIKKKIKKIYNKQATVIYPPVDINSLLSTLPTTKENFYLTIGRLYPYKKIDLIVKTFNKSGQRLVVIGDGIQRKLLEKTAKANIEFRGFVDEDVKIELLRKAKGFVFAAEEDFGIVMVEALAAGTPVIAYSKGGAKEIIKNEINGLLFTDQTSASIQKAVEKFEKLKFDQTEVAQTAKQFSAETFRERIRRLET